MTKQNKKPYPTTTITKSQEAQQKIITIAQAYDNLTSFLFLVCAKRLWQVVIVVAEQLEA